MTTTSNFTPPNLDQLREMAYGFEQLRDIASGLEWTKEEAEFFQELAAEFFQEMASQRRIVADLLQVARTLRNAAARISARGVPPGFALVQRPHTDATTGTVGVQTVVFIPNNT